jgi:DNA repair protein RadD
MKARPYQVEAENSIYTFFQESAGNPIVCVPTGGGKSVIIGSFTKNALGYWPSTRVMILSHVKELLEQNYNKLLAMWPSAPAGIYSAGLGKKQLHGQVTVAGIQSVYKKGHLFGWIDLLLVDECHLLSPESNTMYRKFIDTLRKVNPALKVIGFSATPFRTKDGMLTYGDKSIFTDICYNVPIKFLIDEGYLVPLVSKFAKVQADLKGIKTVAGDYNQKQLQEAVDKHELTESAIKEIFEYASDRKSWLLFCSGIQHAQHVTEALQRHGIAAACVSGETPANERERILEDLKSGKLRAVCNYGVLTTGFDAPNIDLIVLLRATKSAGLYIQMLGRGTRVIYPAGFDISTTAGRRAAIAASPKRNCLVLDFAGNISNFGPVDKIEITNPKKREGEGGGGISIVPQKICPGCRAPNHFKAASCEYCEYQFPLEIKHNHTASEGDILSTWKPSEWCEVSFAEYRKHEPSDGRPATFRADYLCGIKTYSKWHSVQNWRFAVWWKQAAGTEPPTTVDDAIARKAELKKPKKVLVDFNDKHPQVLNYAYN